MNLDRILRAISNYQEAKNRFSDAASGSSETWALGDEKRAKDILEEALCAFIDDRVELLLKKRGLDK